MSGGVSFYLVHPLSSPHLYLFGGVHGRELLKSGLRGVDLGSGSGVKPLWSGDNESGLVVGMLEVARGRVLAQLQVGSGRGSKSGRGRGRDIKVGPVTWPGPGV